MTWRVGGQPGIQIAALSALIALAAGGMALGPYGIVGALALGIVALLIFAQASLRTTIRITLRSVIVETRWPLGPVRRIQIPLDEIREVKVAASDSGDWALVVGTDTARHRLAPRSRREHLEWLCERVEHARALFAHQERLEGREWSFLRKIPDELDELLQHTAEEPLPAPAPPPPITRP